MSPSPHDEETARKVLISASIALAIMVADFIYLFRSEVKLVWPKLKSWGHPKGYVVARYLGLGCQIYNVFFTVRMYLGVSTTIERCRLWFSFQAASVLILLLIAEFMLMYRIYALFLKSKVICSILITLFVGQTAAMVVSAVLSFPSNKHTVTCLIVKSSVGNVFFSTTTMATNILIFFMTFWRYLRLPKKCSQQGHIQVAFRDSAFAVLTISLIMLFMTLCSLRVIRPTMSGNITYYWFVCILFLAIGRLVVDHQKIYLAEAGGEENDTWKGSVQLTSMIEVGESVWSLDTEVTSSDLRTPSDGTLKVSLSTSMTKASELSPSSCGSESTRKWYGDHPFGDDVGERKNGPRPSTMQTPTCASEESSLPSSGAVSNGDASWADDHSADAVANEEGQKCRNSPRPSNTTAAKESVSASDEPPSSSGSTDECDVPRSEELNATAREHEHSPSSSSRPSPCPSLPPQS